MRSPLGIRHLDEAELTDVAREGSLRDVDAAGGEELPQVLLTGDAVRGDELADRGVTFGLGHGGRMPARCGGGQPSGRGHDVQESEHDAIEGAREKGAEAFTTGCRVGRGTTPRCGDDERKQRVRGAECSSGEEIGATDGLEGDGVQEGEEEQVQRESGAPLPHRSGRTRTRSSAQGQRDDCRGNAAPDEQQEAGLQSREHGGEGWTPVRLVSSGESTQRPAACMERMCDDKATATAVGRGKVRDR